MYVINYTKDKYTCFKIIIWATNKYFSNPLIVKRDIILSRYENTLRSDVVFQTLFWNNRLNAA